MGRAAAKQIGPDPLGPMDGLKGQISLNYNNYRISQFQRFLYQTLYVFLQIKNMKYIERDFCSDAWVMPQGWNLGAPGVPRWSKKIFEYGHMAY